MTQRSFLTSLLIGIVVGAGAYLLALAYEPPYQLGPARKGLLLGEIDPPKVAQGGRFDPRLIGGGAGLLAMGLSLMIQRPRAK